MNLSIERLREVFAYNKDTGVFTRLAKTNRRAVIGSIGGSRDGHGHIRLDIDGVTYMAHRLAWLYVYGTWPKLEIDHINGIRDDNRITNLRDVSHVENSQNRHKAPSHSISGVLGASFIKSSGKYKARITIDGKMKHLGHFYSAEEAHAAYLKAKREEHKTCAI